MTRQRPNRRLPLLLSALVTCGFCVPGGNAAVIEVPDEHATIGAALAAAVPDVDEIHVSDAGSPYIERITLKDGVSVIGGYAPDFSGLPDPETYVTVIQAPAGTGTVVDAGDAKTVLFSGFTVTGAEEPFAGGGIFCGDGTSLVIANCVITGNTANTGAGVQISGGSSATLYRCTIEGNTATLRGGGLAVAANADLATVDWCTIRACSSAVAGQAAGGGGGAYIASPIWFKRNRVDDNYTGNDGGGLYVKECDLRSDDNLLHNNTAGRNGGGVYHELGSGEHYGLLVEGCRALAGTGGHGGGVYCAGGANRFLSSFIRSNFAAANGGGFYLTAADAEIRLCEINLNAADQGGGLFISGGIAGFSFSEIYHNTITGNVAAQGPNAGGGLHVELQDLSEVVNNIIALQAVGCGIYCVGVGASPNLRYNCVYNLDDENTAPEYGGDCDDRTGINGNILANPQFCDRNADPPDLALQATSPCLENGEGEADIGAHDATVACGVVAIEGTSWGQIKALYR